MRRRHDAAWHLYHIIDDETELKDLSKQYPDWVQQMDSLWNNWAKKVNVFPKPKKKNAD